MSRPTLGEIVRGYRKARNMSQAAFAQKAKVNPSTVYNIEKGRTDTLRTEQFDKVAKAMEMTAESLMTAAGSVLPITLSSELSEKARKFAAAEGRDVMEFITDAIESAEPSPEGKVFDAPVVEVTQPAETRRRGGKGAAGKAGTTH